MILQIWFDKEENSYTFMGNDNSANIWMLESCDFIKSINGFDWDDCMTQAHEYLEWEPYKPMKNGESGSNDSKE